MMIPPRWLTTFMLALVTVMGATTIMVAPVAADVTIGVTPAIIRLQVDANTTAHADVVILNSGESSFSAQVEIGQYRNTPVAHSAVDWLDVQTPNIKVEPGEEGQISVILTVPPNVPSGGRYAILRVTTHESEASEGFGPSVQGQVVVPVIIEVNGMGDVERIGVIDRFAPFVESDGRVGFRAHFVNRGNIHTSAPGEIDISTEDDRQLATMDISASNAVLPGTDQTLRATGTLPLPTGETYTATASIDYGGDEPAEASVTFHYEPVTPVDAELAVCENLDRGPTVTVDLTNPAEIGQMPTVQLELLDDSGNRVTQTALPADLALWPGDHVSIGLDLPQRLESGTYSLVANVSLTGDDPVVTDHPFEIGGNSDLTVPLCAPIGG